MNVVFATSNAWVDQNVYTNAGEPWDAEDQLVKSHPHMFSDDPKYARRTSEYVPPMEDASADPGTGRTTTRRPTPTRTRG